MELVGIEHKFVDQLRIRAIDNSIPEENIRFTEHLKHNQVNEFLDSVSIGLVPYELSSYNAGRVPIKIVEYASKGIWILASEDFAGILRLPANTLLTYKSGDSEDLADKINNLCERIRGSRLRNPEAVEFAKLRTYRMRARKVIIQLESLGLE